MPKQTAAKGGALAKFGQRLQKAHEEHKDKPAEFGGGGRLPSGIENGIAQLTDCKIGTYEKGDYKGEQFFMAAGTIVSPTMHEGGRILGMRTQIGPHPLCDTPAKKGQTPYPNQKLTFEDHYAWFLNVLKQFDVDVAQKGFEDMIDDALATLAETKPYFKVRTWKPDKKPGDKQEPRVLEIWGGVTEYTSPDNNGEVVDETSASPSDATVEEETEADPPFGDKLDMIVNRANADDDDATEAQNELAELAAKVGVSKKKVTDAPSWEALADLIREKAPAEATEEDETVEEEEVIEEEEGLQVGNVGHYLAQDKKDPKKRKKVEVEIVEIADDGKLTLKNLDDGKTKYKGVAADKFTPAE